MKAGTKHRSETRARIQATARAAVQAGTWPSPGPLWTPAEDAVLGTVPDTEVSRMLGRSLGSIAARRHKLGIASPRRAGRPPGSTKRAGKRPVSNNDGSPSV